MAMTVSRLISPVLRSGLLIAAGTALMVGPTALELSVGAILTGFVVGILATALGIAGTGSDGRGTISVSAQAVYDRLLALGLLLAALAFGFAGERLALAAFGAIGLMTLLVAVTTRYTVRPA
jgi:hypothetical protein